MFKKRYVVLAHYSDGSFAEMDRFWSSRKANDMAKIAYPFAATILSIKSKPSSFSVVRI